MFDDGSDVNSDFDEETPFQRKERELLSEKMAITAELEAYRKTPGLSMVSTAASQFATGPASRRSRLGGGALSSCLQ